jgi:hypothetical protein
MSVPAGWLRELLARVDPLAAWQSGEPSADAYASEAQLAAADLQRVHGLGHARNVVADAIDRLHPGFFAAAEGDDAVELNSRLGLIAREIWESYGAVVPAREPSTLRAAAEVEGPPPSLSDSAALVEWLRGVEQVLEADEGDGSSPRPVRNEVRSELVAIVDRYEDAAADQQDGARLAFARFRLVRYDLSAIAASQARMLIDASAAGDAEAVALARLLFAEALLDGGPDWRDELLVLRDARQHAERLGLPFASVTRRAAGASTERTAHLLLGVIGEPGP